MALKHKTLPAGTDRPGFTGITPSLYAEEHLFSGGAHGSVLTRNTGGTDGAGWVASAQGVLASTGTNQLPSFVSTIPSPIVWGSSGFSIPSQAAGDIFYAPTSATIGRVNGTGFLKLNGSSAPTVVAGMQLIHEGSGTATAGGAANVSTLALASSLTMKDSLLVIIAHENPGGAAAIGTSIYNSTDSVTMTTLSSALGNWYIDYSIVVPHTTTLIGTHVNRIATNAFTRSTFTTNWTGAWTIALRHNGITGPDTWVWKWAIYKLSGQ